MRRALALGRDLWPLLVQQEQSVIITISLKLHHVKELKRGGEVCVAS